MKKAQVLASTQSDKQADASLHVMAAVALSELASTTDSTSAEIFKSKKDCSTQTEHSSPEEWLNFESDDANSNARVIYELRKILLI